MKKVLITGAYGQLGRELQAVSAQVPGFLFLFTDYDTLDITDSSALSCFFDIEKPDYAVNCAAFTAVDKAEDEPDAAEKLNAAAPAILAMICALRNVNFIHISTDYVFDGSQNRPYREDDPVKPLGTYGRTKQQGETGVLSNRNAIILRTSWLYSAYGNNFVKTMIRLGKEKEILPVVFDQVGTPTFARDLALAIVEIIRKSDESEGFWRPGIYHYSNEGVCSWYDFALAIHRFAGISCAVYPVESEDFPSRTVRPHYSVLNKHKIKSTFGIEIPYWMDSLKQCIHQIKSM